ncbi:hypothetical protein DFH08DRAFT_165253 [Mycena albidolilacea]|uniref:F-box domain-containing protein n=1 Tax=Mycena albidolilacea TaxID=1033008 RepID=A0AAD7AQU0_9AGAR|nr:hypothetical protein DFH08DRAFT_165253 [Mycena albidolilacea]
MDSAHLLSQMSTATSPNFESLAKILIEASEANIARIESQIRDLERLRDQERGLITRLRVAIAPIHKLPAEILVEIFRLALDTWSYTRKQRIQKVQALSHVCAYWRRVAHTTPRLWTEMLFTRLDKTPKSDYMACMKGWLERSAPMPIPVYLEISGKARDACEALMDIIATAAHRWSDVHLTLPSLSVLSRIPTASLKSLERVFLQSTDAKHRADSTRVFLMAEHLHHARFATRRTGQLLMPWSQLTEIEVTDPSPQECLDTLVQCTSIVSAHFETGAWPDVPDPSQRPITTLGRLEDLSVSVRGCVVPFFVCLALPALKKLCLESHMDDWSPWGSVEFTQFQLRSPSIQCLEINSSYLLSSDLLAVLQHAPLLAELQMESCPNSFDDSVVGALQYTTTQTLPLVPRLEVIQLYYAEVSFEEDALDAMIQSRWWTDEQLLALPSPPKVARWSSIDIHCGDEEDNVTGELGAKLEQYRSQGLNVRVR